MRRSGRRRPPVRDDVAVAVAVDQRGADVLEELDLRPQVLDPLSGHVVSELGELDLGLAQRVPLDLLGALAVGDQRQRQVPGAEQDDHEVIVELAHAEGVPCSPRRANHRETAV